MRRPAAASNVFPCQANTLTICAISGLNAVPGATIAVRELRRDGRQYRLDVTNHPAPSELDVLRIA